LGESTFDLLVVPYHSWPKVQREGARTRDAHLISQFAQDPRVRRVLVVNRPVSLAEMLARGHGWKTRGIRIDGSSLSHLSKIDEKLYSLDYVSRALLGPVFRGKQWFFSAFAETGFKRSIKDAIDKLGMTNLRCISLTVFAQGMVEGTDCRYSLFDAWDNFTRFPEFSADNGQMMRSYREFARNVDRWTTNSETNREFYATKFGVRNCLVVRNGVDIERFGREYPSPDDLANIKRPIAGIGAKVSYIFDVELLNRITLEHPDVSFVLVGQVLDNAIMDRIEKRPNFHYLGDKHYDDYPAYVRQFNACLIPYVEATRQHGGDSIKFYEYLAAGKPIIARKQPGIDGSIEGVFAVENGSDFSQAVSEAVKLTKIARTLPEEITWRKRAQKMLAYLLDESI